VKSSRPRRRFLFFCDFEPELAKAVTEGRRREFKGFAQFAGESETLIPDPSHADSFERSKLDWLSLERPEHASWLEYYGKLLALRREHIVPCLSGIGGEAARYTALSRGALTVSWMLGHGSMLELRLNLAHDKVETPTPPAGDLIHCEPASARAAFDAGELPGNACAVYLQRTAA
jgi:maltooligosyltrehalose trehalohydrolase